MTSDFDRFKEALVDQLGEDHGNRLADSLARRIEQLPAGTKFHFDAAIEEISVNGTFPPVHIKGDNYATAAYGLLANLARATFKLPYGAEPPPTD